MDGFNTGQFLKMSERTSLNPLGNNAAESHLI